MRTHAVLRGLLASLTVLLGAWVYRHREALREAWRESGEVCRARKDERKTHRR